MRSSKLRWAIVVTAFCLLHLLIFTRVFYSGGPDVGGYYNYATKMGQGEVVYRDFSVEYPPGALAVFYLPYVASHNLHLVADDFTGYSTAFTFEMLIFDLAGLFFLLGIARRAGISPWKVLIGYTLAMIAIGNIAVQRFDMVPAVMMLAAVYFFSKGNYKTAWVLLAVGTMTKLFPGALAPVFLIYQWRRGGWRSLVGPVVAFAVAMLAIALPLLALDSHGFIQSFTVQSQRPLQLESTYSSLLLVGNSLGLVNAQPVQGPVSFDLLSPLSGALAKYSFLLMGLGMLAVYWLYFRSSRRLEHQPGRMAPQGPPLAEVLNYCFAAITVLLATSKVFSPQFMVWLYPLFPLVSGRLRSAVWLAFLAAACLTWYIYPLHYYDLVDTQGVPVDALFLRNTLIVLLAAMLLGQNWSDSAEPVSRTHLAEPVRAD